jgi:hypothetical protein
VTSTILWTEFLLQFRKQQEDSAILLASNRPHNKDWTKKQRKTEREKNRERQRKTPQKNFKSHYCSSSGQTKTNTTRITAVIALKRQNKE